MVRNNEGKRSCRSGIQDQRDIQTVLTAPGEGLEGPRPRPAETAWALGRGDRESVSLSVRTSQLVKMLFLFVCFSFAIFQLKNIGEFIELF